MATLPRRALLGEFVLPFITYITFIKFLYYNTLQLLQGRSCQEMPISAKSTKKLVADEKLSPSQIYYTNETGVFYDTLPQTPWHPPLTQKHRDIKKQATLLTCSNANGKHTLPPEFMRKSAKSRASKHIHLHSLP